MENAGSNQHLSKKQERHLFRLGRRLMLNRHPNPQRIGCPLKAELKDTAVNRTLLPQSKIDSVIDHITICSPCFREFSRYRQNARLRKRLPLLVVAGAVLAAAALTGAYITGTRHQRQPQIIAPVPPAPLVPQALVLDLRSQAPLRGDEPQVQLPTRPGLRLPRVPAELSVYLPVGSDEGIYILQITSMDKQPLLTIEGKAMMQNDIIVLHIQIDLHQLNEGDYFFALRQPPWPWSYYRVEIE
jgi:hypothetical protein